MAYKRSEILATAIEAINTHDLTTVAEVVCYLPCSESILYETEDWKLEVLEPIKKELERKKTSLKAKMKKDWRKSESNPTLQIAAFKLMATDDELSVLSTSKVQNEHSGKDGKPIESKHVVEFHDYSNGSKAEV